MKTRIVATALIEKNGKILMGKKVKNIGPYPNTWHLPGGGIEEGESFKEAVRREVMEETGLKIRNIMEIAVLEDDEPNKIGELTHYIFHILKADPIGNFNPTEELPVLEWVDIKELKNAPLARPSIVLFKRIGYL